MRAGELWTIRADGKRLRRVTRGGGPYASPSWSPDGRRILTAVGAPGRRQIVTMNTAGRRRNVISATADGRYPDWQPAGFDPVIAAAGDIACAPGSTVGTSCRHRAVSDKILADTAVGTVLILGDEYAFPAGAHTFGETRYISDTRRILELLAERHGFPKVH